MTDKYRPNDTANYLKTREDIISYLKTVIEKGDADDFEAAIANAARAFRKLLAVPISPNPLESGEPFGDWLVSITRPGFEDFADTVDQLHERSK